MLRMSLLVRMCKFFDKLALACIVILLKLPYFERKTHIFKYL